MALMGGVNNTQILRNRGTEAEIDRAVSGAIAAGIDIIAPECAVPLDTPMSNLRRIADATRSHTV